MFEARSMYTQTNIDMFLRSNAVLNKWCRHPRTSAFPSATIFGLFILTCIFAFFSVGSNNSKAESTLRFLSIIHRHGERNPHIFKYPLDPYGNESYYPEGRGELIPRGIFTLYCSGKLLRKRYDGFIPSRYKASELLVFSSIWNRAVMSAQALLAGLYPPVGEQIWNSELLWHPIPVQTIPESSDNLFLGTRPCPRLAYFHAIAEQNETLWLFNENRDLLDYVNKTAGLEIQEPQQLFLLIDTLMMQREKGLELPEWTRNLSPHENPAVKRFYLNRLMNYSRTATLQRLYSGRLVHDLVTNMIKKRDSKEMAERFERLLTVYSGHDTTLLNLWRAIGITQEVPLASYGATMIFELHEINSKYRVKILYKNHGLDKELSVVNIKGCEKDQDNHLDDMCDLDVFRSSLEHVFVTDFEKECKMYKRIEIQ